MQTIIINKAKSKNKEDKMFNVQKCLYIYTYTICRAQREHKCIQFGCATLCVVSVLWLGFSFVFVFGNSVDGDSIAQTIGSSVSCIYLFFSFEILVHTSSATLMIEIQAATATATA